MTRVFTLALFVALVTMSSCAKKEINKTTQKKENTEEKAVTSSPAAAPAATTTTEPTEDERAAAPPQSSGSRPAQRPTPQPGPNGLMPHQPDPSDPDYDRKKREWMENYPEEYNGAGGGGGGGN